MDCSGNIQALQDYEQKGGDLQLITYDKFGKKHSLIMGAFRNQQYDTVVWLVIHGCRLTIDEQSEIDGEYLKLKTIELLASNNVKESLCKI